MARARVLIVEDDAGVRAAVTSTLEAFGYEHGQAPDGPRALEGLAGGGYDLVLLDVRMPGPDGHAVLAQIRAAWPALPVIFLTARGEEHERVRGLRGGADDYVVKPFGADELIARIEAVLRRSAERPAPVARLVRPGLVVDFRRREVRRPGRAPEPLPEREAELLAYLAASPGRAISRDELLRYVWGLDPSGVRTRTVDMAVARLREHLGDDPLRPAVVVTVRGRGYMLAPDRAAVDAGGGPREG